MVARSRSQRLEEKRRRRERRQEKREGSREVVEALARLRKLASIPAPSDWPGHVDPSLARPDLVKFDFGQAAFEQEPGKSKVGALKRGYARGPRRFLPDIEHWAMEEFFWHGIPGDNWSPLEAFLAREERRFPPAAREQLRRWKEAELGAFEVGPVKGSVLELRPWDLLASRPSGASFDAIAINMGGVNAYGELEGSLTVTYVAPWTDDLFCAMGYGITVPRRRTPFLVPYLALRQPDIVARPYPWAGSEQMYLSRWKTRDWHGWLSERLEFPFKAVVSVPPSGEMALLRVSGLIDVSPDAARELGIYLECSRDDDDEDEVFVCGATAVLPVDIASANSEALAEYVAFRDRVGAPPGVRGRERFLTITNPSRG